MHMLSSCAVHIVLYTADTICAYVPTVYP